VENLPLWAQALALVILLMISAFFSIAENSMMALNRYRLRHLAKLGNRSAKLTEGLLKRTEELLGTILLGNNLVNTAVTTLVTAFAIKYFGNNDTVLVVATTVVALLIIVFCEITPKVIGATYPEKIALPASYALRFLMRLLSPIVWVVNLVVRQLFWLMRIKIGEVAQAKLSNEELRSIVLESAGFMPHKHRSILINLFDLEHITVDDVMTPRMKVEALDVAGDPESIKEQLITCYHNKLPVFEGELNQAIGTLHVRRVLSLLQKPSFEVADLKALLVAPYFIPSGTPAFRQLQFFQETRQRLGLVVDEYGEVLGLVSFEDIVEEIVGEFTTTIPGGQQGLAWNDEQEITIEAATSLRVINRRLNTHFPLDGPKTLNGFVLELLQELPEAAVSLKFGELIIEVTQMEDHAIRTIKLKKTGAFDALVTT
jgi:Mg2+/Co2+ transporter CorB